MSFLRIENLTKAFPAENGARGGEHVVFRDLSLEVEAGEFVSLLGHSGCGKTTLVNIVAGFEHPSAGRVLLEEREVREPGLERMVVFQHFALMPWLSAFENVRLAVRAAHPEFTGAERGEAARKYLRLMGLGDLGEKRPRHLSGGMRQRVGLARAFAVEPKVLLLDEPFAQIDALNRGAIQGELEWMYAAYHTAVIMVTHDVDDALLLSDRIALMTDAPEARVGEIVTVDIPRPRSRETLPESPAYPRLRRRILEFLQEESKRPAALDV